MEVKIKCNEPGRCPYCESEDIQYDAMEYANYGNYVYYPATCNKCHLYFQEWYHLSFEGMNVGNAGQYQAEEFDSVEYEIKDPLRINRCRNCACLVSKDNKYYCDEMQQYCEEIDECMEGNNND